MPLWMEYAIQFKTLAASCDWNEGDVSEGLNFEIQDEIVIHELPQDLEEFINLATRVEVCLRLRQRRLAPARLGGWRKPSLSRPTHHLNRACLILSPYSWGDFDCLPERDNKGWFRASASTVEAGPLCSIVSFKSQGPLVNRGVLVGVSPLISPQSRTQFSATITYQDSIHSCKALIDSGAEASSLECSTAKSWGIPAIPLSSPVTVWGLSGQPVATITHTTPCVILVVSGNHSESVVLFRMKSSNASLVLGHPWLV